MPYHHSRTPSGRQSAGQSARHADAIRQATSDIADVLTTLGITAVHAVAPDTDTPGVYLVDGDGDLHAITVGEYYQDARLWRLHVRSIIPHLSRRLLRALGDDGPAGYRHLPARRGVEVTMHPSEADALAGWCARVVACHVCRVGSIPDVAPVRLAWHRGDDAGGMRQAWTARAERTLRSGRGGRS